MHGEPGGHERGLHGVDDLPRQEGGDDFGPGFVAALADEALEAAAVELVGDGAEADAVVVGRIVYGVGGRELFLGLLHAGEVEVALLGFADDAGDVLFRCGGHGIEGAACGGNGCAVELADLFLEGFLDPGDDGGDLRDVMDLAVEHGACLVFEARGFLDVEAVRLFFRNDADDAAGADVEREEVVLRRALRVGGGLPAARRPAAAGAGSLSGGGFRGACFVVFVFWHKDSSKIFSFQKKVILYISRNL